MAEFIDTNANSPGADGASQVCGNSLICIPVAAGLITVGSNGIRNGCASLKSAADSEGNDATLPLRQNQS